ncbi:MAG: acyl-CoA dehydrogenase family protein [Gaiellales bacterium]
MSESPATAVRIPGRLNPIIDRVDRFYSDQVLPREEELAPRLTNSRLCMLKLQNDEAFYRVVDRAVQIHGGAGMMKDNPINRLFLIARNLRVPGGSDEVQRTTIAQTLGL